MRQVGYYGSDTVTSVRLDHKRVVASAFYYLRHLLWRNPDAV